jgi:hypothetical protein
MRDVSDALASEAIERDLDRLGYAVVPSVLDAQTCAELRGAYDRDELYRSTVDMARHGFGRGEYRYFGYPLPALIQTLRERLYAATVPIANRWMEALGARERFPASLPLMLELCAGAGQTRPTALVLRYGVGDHNALHQDTYGEVAFPFQATMLLSDPAHDFRGGEFVLVEQRPRKQSLVHVVPLGFGDAVIFPNRLRPLRGPNGTSRTVFRHGVSEVTAGNRYTLGVILHDAQ